MFLISGPGGDVNGDAYQGRTQPEEPTYEVGESTDPDYEHWPPTSGPYYPRTAGYGVPRRWIDEGYWVHTLRHGGTVVLYQCDSDCAEVKAKLGEAVETFPPSPTWDVVKLLALPTTNADAKITLVAHNHIDEMEAWDRERAEAFYRMHLDEGPHSAP